MAAGFIQTTVTTATGESVELTFWSADTSNPTTAAAYNVSHLVNTAGASAAFGSGANGATVLRVGQATDGPGVLDQVAHDAVDSGNPIKIGGYASATAPANVSAGADRANAWFLLNGALAVAPIVGGVVQLTTSVNATFNRASNTTSYAANDLVNASATGATGATISWSIPAGAGALRRVDVRHNATGSTGFNTSSFRVWLFNTNITPTTNVGDNDVFSEPLATCIGFVDVNVTNAGTDVVKGWTNTDIPFVAGTLYGLVQILTSWTTPTASATFNIDLEYLPG